MMTVAAATAVTPKQARRDGPSETRTAGGLCMPPFNRQRVGDAIVRLDEALRDLQKKTKIYAGASAVFGNVRF